MFQTRPVWDWHIDRIDRLPMGTAVDGSFMIFPLQYLSYQRDVDTECSNRDQISELTGQEVG